MRAFRPGPGVCEPEEVQLSCELVLPLPSKQKLDVVEAVEQRLADIKWCCGEQVLDL